MAKKSTKRASGARKRTATGEGGAIRTSVTRRVSGRLILSNDVTFELSDALLVTMCPNYSEGTLTMVGQYVSPKYPKG